MSYFLAAPVDPRGGWPTAHSRRHTTCGWRRPIFPPRYPATILLLKRLRLARDLVGRLRRWLPHRRRLPHSERL